MLSTYLHTVRYLKPVQFYGRLRSHLPLREPGAEPAPSLRERRGPWQKPIPRPPAQLGPNRFRFLNQERSIAGWNDASTPRLWLYHLHYFEHPETELIERWITENTAPHGAGWEPYPLSLRIANWTKWILGGAEPDGTVLDSLAAQARCLSRRLEYHLLGNHLLANAKALVFAGCFFDAPCWLKHGLRVLSREVPEQVLTDGGHFERSPMYHCLVLEDLLDLVNLGRVYPGLLPDWSRTAARMLGWLWSMIHPDGRIPFFNDAAFGMAPEPAALFDYAARLGIEVDLPSSLLPSGYVRLTRNGSVVLFDAAPLGPDYQPGHAHADALSLEVSHRERRILVNSGTSTYEPGPERLRQRGTAAHNTAVVDGVDQSEVWAAFRVARRARPFDVKTDGRTFAEASHDGYARLKNPVIHLRRIGFSQEGLLIEDTLTGCGEHDVDLFFHFHPDADPVVHLDAKLVRRTEPGTWHPEFNVSVPNHRVAGHYRGPLPVTFRSFLPLG